MADCELVRVQARITLPDDLCGAIDAARMRWNPELASKNPAHITIVYHDEAPDPGLLRSRLERVCRGTAPFALCLGAVEKFSETESGACIKVADPTGGVEKLRRAILAPPFTARAWFGLHVTLLHPTYGFRLAEAWLELPSLQSGASFVAERIDLITGIGPATETLVSLTLSGASAADV